MSTKKYHRLSVWLVRWSLSASSSVYRPYFWVFSLSPKRRRTLSVSLKPELIFIVFRFSAQSGWTMVFYLVILLHYLRLPHSDADVPPTDCPNAIRMGAERRQSIKESFWEFWAKEIHKFISLFARDCLLLEMNVLAVINGRINSVNDF